MIIETILSSCGQDGTANFAPMGVRVPDDCRQLSAVTEIGLALYPGSHTFANLQRVPEGTLNLTDDVLSFVDAALDSGSLPAAPSQLVRPPRMAAAKAVWEFSIMRFDDSACPAQVEGRILLFQELGGYAGFCRAQGAVLEAAILATRLPWTPAGKVLELWPLWQEVVAKTGGVRERAAFRKLADYFVRQGIALEAVID